MKAIEGGGGLRMKKVHVTIAMSCMLPKAALCSNESVCAFLYICVCVCVSVCVHVCVCACILLM